MSSLRVCMAGLCASMASASLLASVTVDSPTIGKVTAGYPTVGRVWPGVAGEASGVAVFAGGWALTTRHAVTADNTIDGTLLSPQLLQFEMGGTKWQSASKLRPLSASKSRPPRHNPARSLTL